MRHSREPAAPATRGADSVAASKPGTGLIAAGRDDTCCGVADSPARLAGHFARRGLWLDDVVAERQLSATLEL